MLNVMFTFFLICMSGVWAVWQSVDASLNSPYALVHCPVYCISACYTYLSVALHAFRLCINDVYILSHCGYLN